jgi:uncharacterized protein
VSDLFPCIAGSSPGFLAEPLPASDEAEGERLDPGLPPVVDAHVHLFPDRMFEAIWGWFDKFGWPIRYRLPAPAVIRFLLDRGVSHVVALTYAHKPGIARELNAFMASLCQSEPRLTALATVFPGEPGAREILEQAFGSGLSGVKLHCHVQCVPPDAPELEEIYQSLSDHRLPLVIHAGREPKSPGYRCDPHALCSADRTEAVLRAYPDLRVCVPHLGSDEYDAYARLLERHENLWLDTTMAVAGYFPGPVPWRLVEMRPERVLYGTDFPNVPFAWDREIRRIARHGLAEEILAGVLGGNARDFFGIVVR